MTASPLTALCELVRPEHAILGRRAADAPMIGLQPTTVSGGSACKSTPRRPDNGVNLCTDPIIACALTIWPNGPNSAGCSMDFKMSKSILFAQAELFVTNGAGA